MAGRRSLVEHAAYRRHQTRRGLLPSSIQASTYVLTRFEVWLGHSLLTATADDVETWLDERNLASRSRYCQISHLHVFYVWAIAHELTGHDPTLTVVRPRLRHYVPRPISDDDLVEAMRQADARMVAWLSLAAFMGLRCQEVAGLRVEDIMSDQGMLLISMAKGRHERLVPLNHHVMRSLNRLDLPHRGHAFTRADGRPWTPTRVSQLINEHLRDSGVRATAHQLRHWFASRLYAQTHDLRFVQTMLGHSSPTTTSIYIAFSPGESASVVRNLGLT